MRVALVHDFLTQYGGAEKVLEAFHEIWPKAPVFTLFYDKKAVGDIFKGWDIKVSPIANLPFAIKKYRWYLSLMSAAIERFDLSDFNLVISDSSAYSKGVITQPNTVHISYIHSPTRYLWSDTYKYLEGLSGAEKLFKKILPPILTYLRQWDFIAAQRPDYIIANSDFVARRIEKYYRRKPDTVIHPPVETDKFKISSKIDDYFLLISRFRPYKRVDCAIKAFNKLKIPLKIIGTGDDTMLKKIAGPYIEFLGFVNDREKVQYLSHCKALIHPQEEDFGIVPLEAMASGRPVIAYKGGGALETIVEGRTGVFFNEQTWESLAEAVIKFKSNEFDAQIIQNHARTFSKDQFKSKIQSLVKNHVQDK
ncbi:glycosyltransferase [Patescibacteria group bacterium AH-259-L05]|nr:glycosyltransferase [Patescibacteria group bacterium AH-259-L05]